jgi:hypothetical protein
MVNPLAQQFNRRLSPILFFGGHVQVINEHSTFLTNRWPINAFSSPVNQNKKFMYSEVTAISVTTVDTC